MHVRTPDMLRLIICPYLLTNLIAVRIEDRILGEIEKTYVVVTNGCYAWMLVALVVRMMTLEMKVS